MRMVLVIGFAMQITVAYADVNTNAAIQAVRMAMDTFISEGTSPENRDAQFVRNMGIANWESQAYTNLAVAISNSFDYVVDNIAACATNQFEKYVVMGTGWVFGDSYYLMMFDRLMDQVALGSLTLDDVRWYNSGHNSDAKLNTLARKFDLPIVSNILHKIEVAGGDTNYCNRVRSGEAKRLYDEFESEMRVLRGP